jgi:Mn2+/Fe2+ NRAMP family transporter
LNSKIFQIALGILAAIGGFVDIGDIVFASQSGAAYGYGLIWAVLVGVIGIATFAEMSGRVAIASQRPVFAVVRQRLGFGAGLITLIASQVVNLLTLTAEIGGIAIVLNLFFEVTYSTFIPIAVIALAIIIWVTPFEWIEKLFGYIGLAMLVFLVSAIHLHPDWSAIGHGAIPHGHSTALYWYFAVGLIAAGLMPYEVYFYSSGAIEERWKTKDLGINRANALLGFGLGGLLSISLIVLAAEVFHPLGVQPSFLATPILSAGVAFGEIGIVIAMVGVLFAVGGAAIDSCFSGAYNMAQFLGWEWGKYRKAAGAPRFTISWMVMLALAFVIVSTGVDPVAVTEYSVIFSVFALPLTYFPLLLIARDKTFMGKHANGPLATFMGWLYFLVIIVAAVAAVPLMFITNVGAG